MPPRSFFRATSITAQRFGVHKFVLIQIQCALFAATFGTWPHNHPIEMDETSVRWANTLFIGFAIVVEATSSLTSDRIYPKSKSLQVNDYLARDHVYTWWRYRYVQFNERTIYRKTTKPTRKKKKKASVCAYFLLSLVFRCDYVFTLVYCFDYRWHQVAFAF